jgi:hypothetical protein
MAQLIPAMPAPITRIESFMIYLKKMPKFENA